MQSFQPTYCSCWRKPRCAPDKNRPVDGHDPNPAAFCAASSQAPSSAHAGVKNDQTESRQQACSDQHQAFDKTCAKAKPKNQDMHQATAKDTLSKHTHTHIPPFVLKPSVVSSRLGFRQDSQSVHVHKCLNPARFSCLWQFASHCIVGGAGY